jgi:hypothetical protein
MSTSTVLVNPPAEEAKNHSAYAQMVASAFNVDASAIANAAFALSRTIAAFIKTHDTDMDQWPWAEHGESDAKAAAVIIEDITGFQWSLKLFAGILSGQLPGSL